MGSKQRVKNTNNNVLPFFIGIIAAIVPLIIRLHVHTLEPELVNIFQKSAHYDLFSFWKSIVFMMGTGLCGFILLGYMIDKRLILKRNIILEICLSVMLLLVWVSFFISPHKVASLMGFVDRYEGTLVWTAYLLIAYISFQSVEKKEHATIVLKGIGVGAFFVFLLGVLQLINLDYMSLELTKYLIVPSSMLAQVTGLSIAIKNQIYSTLYNPNFVATYAAMLLPLSIFIFWDAAEKRAKWFSGLLVILNIINLVGCYSSSGYVALVVMLLVFGGIQLVHLFKVSNQLGSELRKFSYGFVVLVLLTIGLVAFVPQIKSELTSVYQSFSEVFKKREFVVSSIVIEDTKVEIKCKKSLIAVELLDKGLNFYIDKEVIQFEALNDTGDFIAKNTGEVDLKMKLDTNQGYFVLNVEGKTIPIGFREGKLTFINASAASVDLDYPEVFPLLKDKEEIGSGRGFIWGRMLPLLKDTLLWGKGADTTAFYFPQNDLTGKMRITNESYFIVDKPHNMYIQMIFQFGWLFVFGFLTIVISLFKQFKPVVSESKREYYMRLAVLLSIIGYLITGFFNDSVINVAPVFWIVFGLGLSFIKSQSVQPKTKSVK